MRSAGVAGGRLMAGMLLLAGIAGAVGCDIENDPGSAARTSGTPTLSVSKDRLEFLLDPNSNASDPELVQPLMLNNNVGALVDWIIITDAPWIIISPPEGQNSGEIDEVGVGIILDKLAPGLNTGSITIVENTGTSANMQEVVVTARICAGACISVNPANSSRKVPSLLFGSQAEYLDSGTTIWDSITTNDCNNPVMPVGMPHQEQLDEFLQLGIGFLRYPSGIPSDFFHWDEAIGPIDSRIPQINPWNSTSSDIKRECPVYGPDEFVEYAGLLNAPIFITTNAGTGTAQEAAEWLGYYEGKGVDAEYWEVGNELYIEGLESEYIFSPYMQPLEYAATFDAHAVALRQVNPNVKVGLVMSPNEQVWNRGVMAAITEPFDYITLHSFQPQTDTCKEFSDEEVYHSLLASTLLSETQLELIRDLVQELAPSNGTPTFSITEWAPWFLHKCVPGEVIDNDVRGRTMASALFSGLIWNSMMRDPSIFSAFHSALSSSKAQATLNIVWRDGAWVPTRSAHYFVQKLYTESIGGTVIPTSTFNSPTFTAKLFDQTELVELFDLTERVELPVLDSIAVLSEDKSRLYVYVVNRSLTENIDFKLFTEDLPNTVTSIVTDTVVSNSFSGENTADLPNAVGIVNNVLATTTNGELSLTLQAHSLVRITLSMAPPPP